MWDICDQANTFRDEEDAYVDTKLDINWGRYVGNATTSDQHRYENLQYQTSVQQGSSQRTVPAISCNFEYVVTDK